MFAASKSARSAAAGDNKFGYVSLLLNGDGTNGKQNNTFLDGSTNNFTITRNGTPTQGSFSPYGSLWSNYFNGSTDYLSLPDNTAIEPGSSDLTWEMWINTTNSTQYATLYSRTTASFATGMWSLMMNLASATAGDVGLYVADYSTAGPLLQTTGVNVRDGAWHHIAVVRNGSAWTLYVDGTSRATGTWAGSIVDIAGGPNIGRDQFQARYFNGYISNLRVVKGTAVYTSSFTPSTTPLTAITNTSLLTCQSNRFRDASSNNFTITANGTPSVQRFSPFEPTTSYTPAVNGGSGYFNGTTDYLTAASNSAFDLGTGDFTLECWVYITSFSSNSSILDKRVTSGGVAPLVWYTDTAGKLNFYTGTNYATTGTFPLNAWTHLVTSRVSGTLYQFINGVSAMTPTTVTTDVTTTGTLRIGASNDATPVYLKGYLTDLRIVKGSGVTSVTVPTAPLTVVTNTSLLLNYTNAGISDVAAINDLTTVGDAKISTAVVKYGTGSMAFDGTGDLLVIPNSQLFNLSSGDFTIEFWFNTNTLTPTGGLSAGYASIVGGQNWNSLTGAGWGVWQYNQTIMFFYPGVILSSISTGNVITATNTWYHVAIVRSGTAANNTKIYINGVQQAQGSPTITNSTQSLLVGGTNTSYGWDSNYYSNGYIDDLRITKGYARYTANFTPPTAALPTF